MVCSTHIGINFRVFHPLEPLHCMLLCRVGLKNLSPHSLVLLQKHLAWEHISEGLLLFLYPSWMHFRNPVYLWLDNHKVLDDLGHTHLAVLAVVERRHSLHARFPLKGWGARLCFEVSAFPTALINDDWCWNMALICAEALRCQAVPCETRKVDLLGL